MLRRYLIELNTTNSIQPIHPIKINLLCFLLLWCNLIEFNWFWCKKIKIFVFCARIKLKGVDTGRTCVKISLYPQENMHYFLCLVKAVDRSSPNFLAICGESTPHYISPRSLLVRIEVHLLTLIWLLGSPHNRKRNCYGFIV